MVIKKGVLTLIDSFTGEFRTFEVSRLTRENQPTEVCLTGWNGIPKDPDNADNDLLMHITFRKEGWTILIKNIEEALK